MSPTDSPADILAQIAPIVVKAHTLREHLATKTDPGASAQDDELIASRLDRWQEFAARHDPVQFARRLAFDDLTLDALPGILGSTPVDNPRLTDEPLPGWAHLLAEVITAPQDRTDSSKYLSPDEPIPFEDVLLPFVVVARRKLDQRVGGQTQLLTDHAYAQLERGLLKDLSKAAGQPLHLEFQVFRTAKQPFLIFDAEITSDAASRSDYFEFCREHFNLLAFCHEYSALARLLATFTLFWIDATADFLIALANDLHLIGNTFHCEPGIVMNVRTSLSDPHHNRRSVLQLEFASGLKVIYKPRDTGIEDAYQGLLGWLNEQIVDPGLLPFKTYRVIDRGTHGWVETIEHLPCANAGEVQRFYHRAGMLLSLLHVCRSTDFHFENLIASGEYPVPVDMEMVLAPRLSVELQPHEDAASLLAERDIAETVMGVGLLPRWNTWSDSKGCDLSGLGSFMEGGQTIRTLRWTDVNTDAMAFHFEDEPMRLENRPNVPLLSAKPVNPLDYVEEVVAGFRAMYGMLRNCRDALIAGPLAVFKRQHVRLILRKSGLYGALQDATLTPEYLREGVDRSLRLEVLCRPFLTTPGKHRLWLVLIVELNAMEQMDIPLFTVRADSIDLDIEGERLSRCFAQSAYERAVAGLSGMSQEGCERQVRFIRAAFFSHELEQGEGFGPPIPRPLSPTQAEGKGSKSKNSFASVNISLDGAKPLHNSVTLLPQERAIEAARGIADIIADSAIRAGSSATWLHFGNNQRIRQRQVQQIGLDIYEGACGIALFLAATGMITGDDQYRELAIAALEPVRRVLSKPPARFALGATSGLGAFVYSFLRVSQWTGDLALLNDAPRFAAQITPERIASTQHLDVIGGPAGAILALSALYRVTADPETATQIAACGSHLLEHRTVSTQGYRAWKTINGQLLTGFAHGAAGIALALSRAYEVTQRRDFLDAAEEAIAYEQSVFDRDSANWPDLRFPDDESPRFVTAWCHGAPGIGLARIGGLSSLDNAAVRADIDLAVNTTRHFGIAAIDRVCCGNMGRIDILLTSADRLSRPEFADVALRQAAIIVQRAAQTGYTPIYGLPNGVQNLGFFYGLSGIGYSLLRLAGKEIRQTLPSILLWE